MSKGSTLFSCFVLEPDPNESVPFCCLDQAWVDISLLSQMELNVEHLPELHILTCPGHRFESHAPVRFGRPWLPATNACFVTNHRPLLTLNSTSSICQKATG